MNLLQVILSGPYGISGALLVILYSIGIPAMIIYYIVKIIKNKKKALTEILPINNSARLYNHCVIRLTNKT